MTKAEVTALLGKVYSFFICLCRISTFLLRNATRDLQESYELERNVGISSRGAHFRESKGFNSKVSKKNPILASCPARVIFHWGKFLFCVKEAVCWREGWFLLSPSLMDFFKSFSLCHLFNMKE